MKMKLWLLRDTNAVADIERFAFDNIDAGPDDIFVDVKQIPSVDFDPLISEQDINIDMGTTTGIVNYAIFDYIASVDPAYPRQNMDKYPDRWFFYVTGMKRKPSSSVVTFHVKLDAVTTLSYARGGLYGLCTKQSYIRRMHKSRFISDVPPSVGSYKQYFIDQIPENISLPMKKLNMREMRDYGDATIRSIKWYLIYKTAQNWAGDQSSGNAISVYLCPSTNLKVSSASSSGTGTGESWSSLGDCRFVSGNWYYISSEWSPNFAIGISSGSYTASSYFMVAIGFTLSGSNLIFDIYAYSGTPGNITGVTHNTYTISPPYSTYAVFTRMTYFRVLNSHTTDETSIKAGSKLEINAGTTSVAEVDSAKFSDIDRTDPLLVKVIELPYCPDAISVNASYEYSVANWNFDQATHLWVPTSSATYTQTLADYLNGDDAVTLKQLPYRRFSALPAVDDLFDDFDPKILHSEFYILKFVYDVYAVQIKLEDFPIASAHYNDQLGRTFGAKYRISADINSVFLLEWYAHYPKTGGYLSLDQDFGQYCVIDRNNEKPLFSNAYLNYMRVGYNFDQKAKSLQNWSAIAGIVISAAGTIVGVATGKAHLTAAGIAGLVGSISSASFGAAQRENAFEENLARLKAQAVSVSGSSDVAILDKYSPWVHFVEYAPIEEVRKSLSRLFHMFGYKVEQFTEPDFVSRSLWNYVEGDVVLDQHNITGIPQEIASRFIEQVANGIAVMHHNDDIGFDTLQKYENWELDLL